MIFRDLQRGYFGMGYQYFGVSLYFVLFQFNSLLYDNNLIPTIDPMSVAVKNSRQNVAGSLKKRIPTITVPTAPIPVQTGYAMPNGMVCVTFANNPILTTENTANPPIQSHHCSPSTHFARPRQYVKPTSHSPATININQFIFNQLPIEGCKTISASPSKVFQGQR